MSGSKAITDTATWCASHFEFAHNDNTFTIELTTKELNRPERLTFAYSFDSDPWITLPIGTNRLTFNKLSPGRHTLCLKANTQSRNHSAKGMVEHGMGMDGIHINRTGYTYDHCLSGMATDKGSPSHDTP